MNACLCGVPVDAVGALCPRCAALRVLELGVNADEEQIRNAHRVMSKVWHPSRFEDDAALKTAAEDKLKEINAAFDYLTSPSWIATPRWKPVPVAQAASFQPAPMPVAATTTTGLDLPIARADTSPQPGPWQRFGWIVGMAALVGVLIAGFVFWNSASPEFKASLAGLVSGSNPADKPQTPAAAGPSGVGLAATPQPDSASTDTARQPSSDLPAASEPPAHRKATGRQAEKIRADNHPVKPGARLIHAFLTVGSTRDEVLSQMGPPTASSDDKLVYGKSELYLKNGCITGWKIDPFANPIRVKLWPDSAVDPTLDFFTIGSTKDDVLVVQGTPTAFSANKYEYAGSVVNFRADQVVSWKSDPGSIPLRARMP